MRAADWEFLPTPLQETLLRAALLQGERALKAWQAWEARRDHERLDAGSQMVLPLLYHNLRAHGVEDDRTGLSKAASQRTWAQNQFLFRAMEELLKAFREAGIPTLILKGAPLALLYYRDYKLRPMADFDLLVPWEQGLEAVGLLMQWGWKPEGDRSLSAFSEAYRSTLHSHTFTDPRGRDVDLHWHALRGWHQPRDADRDFWENAVPVAVRDVSTLTLSPTDHLLHVCAHGARWNEVPPCRWVADAMIVLDRSLEEIDWGRLVMLSEKRDLALSMRITLGYLKDALDAPVPAEVLQQLDSVSISKLERREFAFRCQSPDRVRPYQEFYLLYLRYSKQRGRVGSVRKLIGFPAYLRDVWEIDHVWQLPLAMVFKGLGRSWKMLVRND